MSFTDAVKFWLAWLAVKFLIGLAIVVVILVVGLAVWLGAVVLDRIGPGRRGAK